MPAGLAHPAVRLLEAAWPALTAAAERMQDNFPYFHPLYAGQMLKPPHPVARAAYAMAMWVNPNNHALDGGRASSAMEREAVAARTDFTRSGETAPAPPAKVLRT